MHHWQGHKRGRLLLLEKNKDLLISHGIRTTKILSISSITAVHSKRCPLENQKYGYSIPDVGKNPECRGCS